MSFDSLFLWVDRRKRPKSATAARCFFALLISQVASCLNFQIPLDILTLPTKNFD